jgi:glycerol uptake operon antiterminator
MPGMARPAVRSLVAGFLDRLRAFPVGAAVKGEAEVERALAARAQVLFILRGNGLELAPVLQRVHAAGKLAAVHLDLVDGLSADQGGLRWLVRSGADAAISARGDVVRSARAHGVVAIQRLLVLDEASIEHGLAAIARAEPDIVELLPGVILPDVRELVVPRLGRPLLAGGFIRTRDDVAAVLAAGALAVTTSAAALWT